MDDPADALLGARITIPEHVVRRRFAEETVALNVRTGRYHGLNGTAAAMLDGLERGESPAAVADAVARSAGADPARVRADLVALVRELAERDLVEIHGPAAP